jgi:hypothetical protein
LPQSEGSPVPTVCSLRSIVARAKKIAGGASKRSAAGGNPLVSRSVFQGFFTMLSPNTKPSSATARN